ncbi:hypothetical protein HON52_02540 [Candidatus Uhrbacteria bacterium]|nr:hypothetical protein [Candidatus Uhrbacteria bacterium]
MKTPECVNFIHQWGWGWRNKANDEIAYRDTVHPLILPNSFTVDDEEPTRETTIPRPA